MLDNVVTLGIKTVMDISDVKANIGVLQSQFNKLKLPAGITDKFNQEISKFSATYEKYQQKMAQGIKTKGDATQTSKYLNEIAKEYDNIVKTYSKASGMDLKSMFKIDSGPLKDAAAEIERLTKQLANVDINKTSFQDFGKQLSGILKNSKFSGEHGLINEMIGSFNRGEVDKAKQALQEIQKEVEKRQYATAKKTVDGEEITYQKPGTYSEANTNAALGLINQMVAAVDQAETKIQDIQNPLNQATKRFDELLNKGVNSFKSVGAAAEKEKTAVHGVVEENKNLVNSMASAQQQSQMLANRVAMYFSLYEVIRKIGDVARRAFQTVKELDASMTQTAVVTNFSVGDMWEKLPQYTATANQLGSTIKDVYDATTLYYQQGLNTDQAMGIATETLKMARIAGIEAAEATDMMTAALRGFNMQINELSAARINDVYSKIAAITASDTEELGSAMTRTASIANSAGMEFETTTAFLAQMIETTREAPENLGTAMKTIIARFQEMKKSPEEFIDEEGNVTSINRVDTALRSVGVTLTDTQGNFRKLDDVFLELASRWDSLSQGQQRYVATMAAGSRQQSRFIAMMSNYERTMELVDAANNSAGASQEQFSKTLDSMDTKLNKLKNAWDQFAMGLTNSTILKGAIDTFTGGITIINKFIDAIGKISPKPFENINKSLITLVGTLGVLRLGGAAVTKHQGILGGLLTGGAGFLQGDSFKDIGAKMQEAFQAQQPTAVAQGNKYGNAFVSGLRTSFLNLKGAAADGLINALNFKIQQGFSKSAPQMRAQLEQSFNTALKGANISGAKLPDITHIWQQQLSQLQAGTTDISHVVAVMRNFGVELDTEGLKAELFTNKITTAGTQISAFGSVLARVPGLETFGVILMQLGGLLSTFGETLSVAATGAKAAAAASLADSAAKGTEAAATIGAAIAQGQFAVATKAAGAALAQFWIDLGPIGWAITAIIALAGTVKLLDLAIETDTEKLDSLQDRASAASDRFSEMKQATTELTDSLDKLAEYDTAFESLVSGTAEFNQQLLESNELVTELIKKYPSLEENGYVTTDANGRMNISQAGREAILEEQQQRQAKAQAIDIFANADYKRQQAVVSEEYKKAEQTEQKVWNEIGSSFTNLTFDEKRAKVLEEMAARGEKSTADIVAKADAASAVARKQAVTSLISSQKDLIDKDSVAEVMATNYDQLINSIEADTSGEKRAQAYAEANNLEYIKGNKFRNSAGEEVEIEKDIWNDEITNKRIKANDQMIDSAGQVDQALIHLNSAAQDVFSNLSSNSLISDILSNNVNTNRDDLAKLLDSGELSKLVSKMSDADAEALKAAGIEDAQAFIEERAKAIQQIQAQQDVNLSARMARATDVSADWFSDVRSGNLIKEIQEQLNSLNSIERTFATNTSQSLEDAFNVDVADNFVKTYTQGSKKVRKEYEGIFKDIDWTSSISALGAMQSALESNVDEVKQLGQSMKDSTAGSHLLNDALQEMSVADDFTKAMENLDNFTEESGRLSAVGIQKMAEESGTLAKMLDTGAISAGGLAAAINATSIDGSIAITDLSDSVLELLQYFGQLDDAIASAHNYIENFNPGIDTGESKDFITDNIEKIKEFANEGEWGNEQFVNYVQSVIGTERWQETLEDVGGNTEKAYNKIKGYINGFSEGYDKMWMNLVNKTDVAGKNITSKVDKNLRNITMTYDKNGDLQLDLAGHSIEDFNKFLQQAEGVTKEQADLMIEDWKNYSYDFAQEWEKNKFQTALKDTNYAQNHAVTDSNGRTIGATITQSEIDTLAAATGKTAKDIAAEIGKALGVEIQQNKNGTYGFRNKDAEGNLREDYDKMARDYNRYAGLGGAQKLSFINQGQFTAEGGGYDIQKIIQGYIQRGFTEVQAQNMTFEQMQRHTDKEYKYNGETIDPKAFDSFTSMAEQFAKIDQNVQWTEIGHAIADGIIEGIKGENTEDTGKTETSTDVQTNSKEAEEAAAKQKVLDNARIQSLEADISTYQKQIEEKENQLKEARAQVDQAKEDLKKAKTDKDAAEQKVSEAEQKVAKKQQELNDLKVLLEATQTELQKWRPQNEGQKGTSKAESTTETPEQGEVNIKFTTDTSELDTAKESIETLKEKGKTGVDVKISTSGSKKLSTVYKKIANLQKASEGGISADVNVKSKGDGGKGVDEIKNKAIKEKGAVVKVTANTDPAKKAIDGIEGKDVTININPSYGPESDWEKAVKVKVKVRKGGKIDDSTGGTVHEPGSGGRITKFAKGGSALTAFVPEGTDTVPAMLTPGEFVQRRRAVQYFGDSFMENINHLNLSGALHSLNKKQLLGSMAKGSRFHGMLGPKNRGGLTLTGEEGYEVAWIPSENRSMILGTNGPEMIDLPSDTVVWNHQESQDIIKKKNIPGGTAAIGAGSMSGRHTKKSGGNNKGGNDGNGGNGGSGKENKKNSKNAGKVIAQWMKWSPKVGKIFNWWENISRKVESTQRTADKNQKDLSKLLSKADTTLSTTSDSLATYANSLRTYIKVNEKIVTKYQEQLEAFNKQGGSKTSRSSYNKASKEVSQMEAAIKAAGDGGKVTYTNSKGKKVTQSTKTAKKKLKSKKDKLKDKKEKATSAAGSNTVSWEDTAIVTTRKGKGKKAKTKKKRVKVKRSEAVNFANIVDRDPITGAWVADENKINAAATETVIGKNGKPKKVVNKKKAKAIKEKANEYIDTRVQRINNAQDNIEKANEDLQKAQQDIFDNFLGWKNELTKIAEITRQIEEVNRRIESYSKSEELIRSQIASGYKPGESNQQLGLNVDDIKKLGEQAQAMYTAQKALTTKAIQEGGRALEEQKAKNLSIFYDQKDNKGQSALELQIADLDDFITNKKGTDNEIELAKSNKEKLEEQQKNRELALSYFKDIKQNANGTIDYVFDTEQFEKDRQNPQKGISSDLKDVVNDIIGEIEDGNSAAIDIYNGVLEKTNDLYQELIDLKEQYAQHAEELLQAYEEQAQEQLDKFKTLNDSITSALKDLLDEVKRRLEERRQAEDNAKTKADISKKQQRLSTLQADTSGGNASTIAQLQQEITEAQQNYGRSLEDQLLAKLEQQNDVAARQRERQIQLQQAMLDLNKINGTNVAYIEALLDKPEEFRTDIQQLWNSAHDTEQQLTARKELLDNEFNGFFLDVSTGQGSLLAQQAAVETAIDDTAGIVQGLLDETKSNAINDIPDDFHNKVLTKMEAIHAAIIGEAGKKKAEELLEEKGLKKDVTPTTPSGDGKGEDDGKDKGGNKGNNNESLSIELKNPTPTPTPTSVEPVAKITTTKTSTGGGGGSSAAKTSVSYTATLAGHTKTITPTPVKTSTPTPVKTSTPTPVKTSTPTKSKSDIYKDALKEVAKDKAITANEFSNTYDKAKAANVSFKKYLQDLANTSLDWGHIINAFDKTEHDRYRLAMTFSSNAFKKGYDAHYGKGAYEKNLKEAKKKKKTAYATGGLAFETGLAWLDGTPTKPELVLNATDTKNFIALKDVLSHVMSNMSDISVGASVEGAPVTYDININVDHLNNDYDVDRVANRVKQIIVKDANYRNVTAVRKFR